MYNSKKIVKKVPRALRGPNNIPNPDQKAVSLGNILAADSTGAQVLLNGLQPGTDIDQRLGRTVQLDRLDLNLVSYATVTTGLDQLHRIVVVVDTQPNGAALAITDVLDAATTWAHPNLANRRRFRILWDDAHHLNASTEPGSMRTFALTLPLRGLRVIFNAGVAGTIADIATNSIYLLSIGSLGSGATAGSLRYSTRLFFRNAV